MIMNVITMPFILVGVVPLILVFCCLRNYYLKTTREIKRLEGTGNPINVPFASFFHRLRLSCFFAMTRMHIVSGIVCE